MIRAEQLVGKYVIINKSAFNERFRISSNSLGCQSNWVGGNKIRMVKFVKEADESDNTIFVTDNSDPNTSGEWISVIKIEHIMGDNSDEDFLLLI